MVSHWTRLLGKNQEMKRLRSYEKKSFESILKEYFNTFKRGLFVVLQLRLLTKFTTNRDKRKLLASSMVQKNTTSTNSKSCLFTYKNTRRTRSFGSVLFECQRIRKTAGLFRFKSSKRATPGLMSSMFWRTGWRRMNIYKTNTTECLFPLSNSWWWAECLFSLFAGWASPPSCSRGRRGTSQRWRRRMLVCWCSYSLWGPAESERRDASGRRDSRLSARCSLDRQTDRC